MASRFSRFLSELKRRKVTRVAVAYAVAGLGIVEGAGLVQPTLGFSSSLVDLAVVLVLTGFPIAVALAWFIELTPAGIRLTQGLSPEALSTGARGKLSPWAWLLAGLALAAVVGTGYLTISRFGEPSEEGRRISIAVLPFANMSGSENSEAFINGIHDDVLTQLSKIHALRVTSRQSVLEYRASTKNMREIANELGVESILEGGVQLVGGRIRLNAQLIDPARDEHIWAETFDREHTLEGIFTIQSDLAERISAGLRAALLPEEARRISSLPTQDSIAYRLAVRGTELGNQGQAQVEMAVELFQQAIQRDSGFSEAYSALAIMYYRRVAEFGYSSEWADSSMSAARRAVALDPEDPFAHRALGRAFLLVENMDAAEESFLQALRLAPSYSDPLLDLADQALASQRCDRAYEWALRASEVNPKSPLPAHDMASAASCLGMDEEALFWLERASLLDEEGQFAAQTLALRIDMHLRNGELARAREMVQDFRVSYPRALSGLVVDCRVSQFEGDVESASESCGELLRMAPDWGLEFTLASLRIAVAWTLLGKGEDEDRARSLLEQAEAWLTQTEAGTGSDPNLHYLFVCLNVLQDRQGAALDHLQLILDANGETLYFEIFRDPVMAEIIETPRGSEIMAQMKGRFDAMRERVETGTVDLGIEF